MLKSRFTKSSIFRCLVMFSILATILLLYNIVNISFARRKKDSDPLAGFILTPEKFHQVDVTTLPSNNLPPLHYKEINDLGRDDKEDMQEEQEQEQEDDRLDLPVDEDPNKLIIVTLHDPDPGQELDAEPVSKGAFDYQPEPDAAIPDEDNFPPASDEFDLDSDRNKSLKESFISLEKEAISQKFLSLGAGTDMDDEPENILSSMQLSEGGKPIRNLIFATWSSGSSFIGEVVASHPLSFYHFEPLMVKGNVQIRPEDEDNAADALNTVKALLNCDYSQVGDLVNYFRKHSAVHEKNPGLWKFCDTPDQLCMDSEFLSEICKLFPYQVVKLVRLRLKLAETLLEDENMDIRVLHLTRDPRGILCSRKVRSPCGEGPVCQNPATLCSGMVDDYHAALELREKYADRFLALRYEDISLSPQHGFEVLLHHFRLQLHPEVQQFLNSHTVNPIGNSNSGNSILNTITTPFQWIDFFKHGKEGLEDLKEIEKQCREAMDLWGYASITTSSDGTATTTNKQFSPVLEPPWSEMRLI